MQHGEEPGAHSRMSLIRARSSPLCFSVSETRCRPLSSVSRLSEIEAGSGGGVCGLVSGNGKGSIMPLLNGRHCTHAWEGGSKDRHKTSLPSSGEMMHACHQICKIFFSAAAPDGQNLETVTSLPVLGCFFFLPPQLISHLSCIAAGVGRPSGQL